MIFVDTSALYAVLDRDDFHHSVAAVTWAHLLQLAIPLWTTNYVLVESCALAQSRLGIDAVRAIEADVVPALHIEWISPATHSLAMAAVLAARRRKLSLVDCSSFVVMRQKGITDAFAFDDHFSSEGFRFPS